MNAIVIDRIAKTIELIDKAWTLEEMQELLGGYLEVVTPPFPELTMFVNDDGMGLKLQGWKIPFMLRGEAGMIPYLGNAIILGDSDEEGELTGLEQTQANDLLAFLRAEILWG